MRFLLSGGVVAAALVAAIVAAAHADGSPQAAAATAAALAPAPSGRVGRVSLVAGKVEFRGPGEAQWSPAAVNDPIVTGVALRTDSQSRAEIRVGADTVDLDRGAEIAVVKLDDPMAEIAVRQGRVDLDIRGRDAAGTVQVDIARGGVRPQLPGRYDIDVGGGGEPVKIAAFTGGARFSGAGTDILIPAGDRVSFGAAGLIAPATEPASGDEFAEWCGARAVDDARLAAPYFVARAATGYAVLDAAGSWRSSAKYGEVWEPKAPPENWAPFRNGHWRWLAPWGWSWVDDQPWGFATSHYGRWLFADGRWAWAPGKLTPRPAWSPAVVAFLGTPGVGLSYADGPGPAIAWFPLAPGEIYWPSYTSDLDYIRAVNAPDVADLSAVRIRKDGEPPGEIVNAHFANREFASVVPRPVFVAGATVATALVSIPDERLRNAPAIMGSPRIGPPPPVRVAAVQPAREHPAAIVRAEKGTAWTNLVRAAEIRSRHFQEIARLRFAHLRLVAYTEGLHLRHSLVLRVARPDHAVLHSEGRRRLIRR
ncbi:MAG: DUF6600 domain-containing protein [Stellaceae bacterium]